MDRHAAPSLASHVMEGPSTATEWDDDEFERVLARLETEGRIEAVAKRISAEHLERILDAAPEDRDHPGRSLFKDASFEEATFQGGASFDGASFQGYTSFREASFQGDAQFDDTTFQAGAEFAGASFEGGASFGGARFVHVAFDRARFAHTADFMGATFENGVSFSEASAEYGHFDFAHFGAGTRFDRMRIARGARFDRARFGDDTRFRQTEFGAARFLHAQFGEVAFQGASFGEASFAGSAFAGQAQFPRTTFGPASFVGASFARAASFDEVRFVGHADFGGASFQGDASFGGARFEADAHFHDATFEGNAHLGSLVVREALHLDRVVFPERLRLEASARALSCVRVQFRRGADLLVRHAEVALDDAEFAEPSTLAPRTEPVQGEEELLREGEGSDGDSRPRVVSLRGAVVADLTIAGADLRACRFEGALGLDQLRIEVDCEFPEAPRYWHYARRRTLAEEHVWRAARPWWGWPSNWCPPECYLPEWIEGPDPPGGLKPGQIAAIYRSLRTGLENRKDEPGAADFYYGEMEMRRLTKPETDAKADRGARLGNQMKGSGERFTLNLYWVVSGYGLRASRALLALGITVWVFAFLFDWWGFRPDQSLGRGLLFSVESTSSLFRVPETKDFALTAGGEVLQVFLRLLGPLFFGLALLSLRGRVKR